MLFQVFLFTTGIKLILIPAYTSTDFEVHRNWLAITHSLPLEKWYIDTTSIWTLDYPPLFAWFQYALSTVAKYFDKEMLVVSNLNYTSFQTKAFMRLSVMVSDFVLVIGCKEIIDFFLLKRIRKWSRWKHLWFSPPSVFTFLTLTNMGLLLIDHIHFQYNGILFGILLISLARVLKGDYLIGAFWFTVLLNMKHIFLYMAPAYTIFLLRNYCMITPKNKRLPVLLFYERFVSLACIVLLVTGISFGPFIHHGQLFQVLERLFPFKRGLCHTYWAPNFWVLYNIADKCLARGILVTSMHGFLNNSSWVDIHDLKNKLYLNKMTSGVLQNYEHVILPTITPNITMFLVLLSIMPCLIKLWLSPGNPFHFVRSIIICTCCAFLFGWHVHEKAILMAIIPLSLMAVFLEKEAEMYTLLSITGHYSLLPLIHTKAEFLLKPLLFILSSFYITKSMAGMFQSRKSGFIRMLSGAECCYIVGLGFLYIYENMLQYIFQLDKKYPFMPLMLTSTYCSLGILHFTVRYYYNFLTMLGSKHKQKIF